MILSAHSATVDGIDDGYEWDNALTYQIINGESNCDVDYAIMKLIIDNENRAVNFCFLFRDPEIEPDNFSAGVSFSLNDSDTFTITGNTKPDNYDANKYSFEGEISVDENHGVTCEIRLGFKEGVPQNICGSVSFIDGKGMPSNKYDIVIFNEGYTERTVTPVGNQGYPENSTLKTTKSNNRIENDKTSNRISTTRRSGYTTVEFIISTSPPYSYSRTSKPSVITSETERKTTEKSTVKQKSTAEHKTKVNKTVKDKVTVYYYEKEVIIYSDIPNETVENTSAPLTVTTTVESVDLTTVTTTEAEVQTTVSVSDGIKYKTVIGVISAILIIILAAWASRSGKKAKDTSNQ